MNSGNDMISLKAYAEGMKPGQQSIYYITGENRQVLAESPFLEGLRSKGYDVLMMTDPIDEYVMDRLQEYNGTRFVCITKEGVHLEDQETKEGAEEAKEEKVKR